MDQVLQSRLISGPGHARDHLEIALAETTSREQGVAANSGTTALEIALRVVGVEGRDVAVPAFGCMSIQRAVRRAGATPRLLDIDPEDLAVPAPLLVDAAASCAAVVLVHQFGIPTDSVEAVPGLAVPVIEDLTTTIGTRIDEAPVGSFGTMGVVSLGATKMICAGEGGAIVGDAGAMARARRWTDPESDLPPEQPVPGAKLSNLAAAMGLAQLGRLEAFLAARREVAAIYDQEIGPLCRSVKRPKAGIEGTWWRYLVELADGASASNAVAFSRSLGVGLSRPVVDSHLQLTPALKVARHMAESLVSVPIYPSLTEGEVEQVVEVTAKALKRFG